MVYLGRNAVGVATASTPTDEQVQDAVDNWLEEHPEASAADPADVTNAVNGWLGQNITNPTNPPLDRTLSSSSAAAPADMVGELNRALDEKAPVIISSASGAIASFPDGADDMPMQSLKVGIEPVQDLHGYDNPWPAGGGKNKLNPTGTSGTDASVTYTKETDGRWATSGTASGTSTFLAGEFDAKAGVSYILNGCPSGGGTATYRLDVRTAPSSIYNNWIDIGNGMEFTPSEDAHFYVYMRATSGTNMSGKTFSPMIRLASESDATYAPYSNICPITGWTGAKVQRTGKNLLKPDLVADQASWNYIIMQLKPNTTYTVSADYPNDGVLLLYAYNSNGWNSSSQVYTGKAVSVTTNADGELRLQQRRTNTTKSFSDYITQVENGSSASELEAYSGIVYSISWQSEAGTVYGGTLDVVSGELVVETRKITSDLIETVYGITEIVSGLYECTINLASDVYADNVKISKSVCSCYKKGNATTPYTYNISYVLSGSARKIFIRDVFESAPSKEDYIQRLRDNNFELVYYLKTPITYSLTPTEVRTLLGQNNIWADTGDVETEYPADTKLYIQNLTKPTEDDMTANVAITSGKFFMINNRLFLATAAIASGAMIIPGTNCTELSLADALNNINA